jgi:hypothetical protein
MISYEEPTYWTPANAKCEISPDCDFEVADKNVVPIDCLAVEFHGSCHF